MREKVTQYSFTVRWVAGKTHYIADALSRAPVFSPEEEDLQIDTALSCLTVTKDPALEVLYSHIEDDYKLFYQDVQNDTSLSKMMSQLKNLRDRLGTDGFLVSLDSKRIVLPVTAIPVIQQRLHNGHPGQEKTIKLASQLYYWPGMLNDIRTFVESCKLCFKRLPSQQHT